MQEITDQTVREKSNNFINAFQLIAMSNDLDLSGLFEKQVHRIKSSLICVSKMEANNICEHNSLGKQ